MRQAIKLLPGTDVKAFPYLRRVISLGRNKDIAKAVDALSDVEAAEITSLMRAVEVGKLEAVGASRLNALILKVEGNLKGSIPGLRVIGRVKKSTIAWSGLLRISARRCSEKPMI